MYFGQEVMLLLIHNCYLIKQYSPIWLEICRNYNPLQSIKIINYINLYKVKKYVVHLTILLINN